MIEVFDNYLSEQEIESLFNTLKMGLWNIEDHLSYGSKEMLVPGGSYYYRLNFETGVAEIFTHILTRLQEHPLIKDKYYFNGAGRNAYKLGDQTGLHTDEGDLTALVYGNKEWHINWGSETVFADKFQPDADIIKSVSPKPGRLVIFDSRIPHTGRPPSSLYTKHRYSVAYSFKKNP
jgi:Rps23 Pro-64 3,4-dihydroxylase Tpa1-like proline 4-hydroxylase